MGTIRCYSELVLLPTFEERYQYLRLGGGVGKETFGFDRYMNQFFYRSPEWRRVRNLVIARDSGCALIHHMNPIRPEDIRDRSDLLLNPEYLISTIHETHQAIHYGDEGLLLRAPIPRARNDTCPWKK